MTKVPHVYIELAKDLEKSLFMTDSGVEINLIRKSELPKSMIPYPIKIVSKRYLWQRSRTERVIKCKIGVTTTILHAIGHNDEFKCDGKLGAEYFRDIHTSISFNEQKLHVEDIEIDFFPVGKTVKSSIVLINNKKKNTKVTTSENMPKF